MHRLSPRHSPSSPDLVPPSEDPAFGTKSEQERTGCGGYLFGKSGQRMKTDVAVGT
jgi:hypothetical protein